MGGVFINNKFTYAIFPLELITDEKYKTLSSDEKVLYTLLLNRMNFSRKNMSRFSDSKGTFVYYSNSQIQKHLGCCENTVIKALHNLQKSGLITKEYQKIGLPLKIYVHDITGRHKNSAPANPKPVSFDVEKAEEMATTGRKRFGDPKYIKSRTKK